jgi:hypothetical protein
MNNLTHICSSKRVEITVIKNAANLQNDDHANLSSAVPARSVNVSKRSALAMLLCLS